jgi:hypothetical protein
MDLRSKARNLSEETAAKHRGLELEVDIELKLGSRLDGNYESNSGLAKIKVEKTLVSTTDSKLKDIKDEIIASIESQFDEIEKVIDNSNRLTDGFWSELNKQKEQ